MSELLPLASVLARVLHELGMLLYAGPFLAFTVLVLLSGRLPQLQRWDVVRVYRAWGSGLGLAMGAWVLGLLSGHYLETGAFTWPTDTPAQQLTAARFAVFLLFWALNVRIEVWALEPLRKLDRGEVTDPAAYARATVRLGREMAVQSTLLLTYVVLTALT